MAFSGFLALAFDVKARQFHVRRLGDFHIPLGAQHDMHIVPHALDEPCFIRGIHSIRLRARKSLFQKFRGKTPAGVRPRFWASRRWTRQEVKRASLPEDVALIYGYVPRDRVVLAQTPQAFSTKLLKEAFARARRME